MLSLKLNSESAKQKYIKSHRASYLFIRKRLLICTSVLLYTGNAYITSFEQAPISFLITIISR